MTLAPSTPQSRQNTPASSAAQRKVDANSEATIIAEANGSYHKVKNHTRTFAKKLLRKYGCAGANNLINGAYRTSDLRLQKHGKARPGNRNHPVECDYRAFLKSLRKSYKSLRKAKMRRAAKCQRQAKAAR